LLLLLTFDLSAAEPDGKAIYDRYCAACHGPDGAGDGRGAQLLYPKPRDFSRGLFKIRSTPDGQLPTDDDLLRTITQGMPGSPMPSFAFLPEADRRAVAQHVKTLVKKVPPTPPTPIAVGEEPPLSLETLHEGKRLYTELGCNKCHGETGKGDGPQVATLKDSWDIPITPRDFTTGVYKGGPSDRDLYLRFTTGLSGTPMASFAEKTDDKQRWALVHYVQSLRVHTTQFEPPPDNIIPVSRTQQRLDPNPAAPSWQGFPSVEIPMMALWPHPRPLRGIYVRALHDGKQLGLLVEWECPEPSYQAVGQQEFRDGAAVQFSLDDTFPFLGMGEKGHPVNVWHWKSDYQTDLTGERRDVDTENPFLYVQDYPRTEPEFITARAAGNLIAQDKRTTPIEDLNAEGFGSLEAQPASQQNVTGKGVWRGGRWRVVFLRDLKNKEPMDRQFAVEGEYVPVAFAIWSGKEHDRNGQKTVSTWFKLKLEK
jgi:mono/diheme cytochrome c family protein